MASNSKTTADGLAVRVQNVRRFNRFYTKQIGVLRRGLLNSRFFLTQVRVMYELASGECQTASDLITKLDLDAGYVSRMLREFRGKRFVERARSKNDGRQKMLRLTKKGREEFAVLNSRQNREVQAMLNRLSSDEQNRLVRSMQTIHRLLEPPPASSRAYVLRLYRPGDLGWVLARHGVLYAREYGWDKRFEALVARIIADFVDGFDAKRERCWIAEIDGERVGSVFLVKNSPTVSKLHLLLVEPWARNRGIGNRLVNECIDFARRAGYRKLALQTNSVLHAARRIYQRAGFKLVETRPHTRYGRGLVGERWELKLI